MTGLKQILHSRRGFTLVELIVVLVILGVVGSISVPALTGYIDNAKEKQAVSETQACVETVTQIAAQKYAEWQQAVVNKNMNSTMADNDSRLQPLTGWAGTTSSTPPAVNGGTVALTEGSGQYYLHTSSWQRGGFPATSDTSSIAKQANVTGQINTLTCSNGGQVVYLVYTSQDGITVVYTNTATAINTGTKDDTVVVPKPDNSTKPDPKPDPEPEPTEKTLKIKIKKVNSVTGSELTGASLVIKQIDTVVAALDSAKAVNEVKLPAGDYILHEESAPAHYLKAADISFSITKDGKNLTLTGGSSSEDSDNRRIVMKDPPVTKKIIFWAADTDKNHIDGIALKITGDLGNRDDPNTPEVEDDTEWISSSVAGHTLDIPLTPGKSYEFRIDDGKTSNGNYNTSGNVKVKINVDANGNMTFDGVLFDGKTGDYFIDTVGDVTHVNLVFPKKEPSKDLILTDENITVTISGLSEWPAINFPADNAYKATVYPGDIYYIEDADGNRTYYSACDKTSKNIDYWWGKHPSSMGNNATEVKDTFTRVWTDSTLDRYPYYEGKTCVRGVKAGDLYLHNGILYMAVGDSPTAPNNRSDPEKDPSGWVNLNEKGYNIKIDCVIVPVQIKIIDPATMKPVTGYDVQLFNPNAPGIENDQKYLPDKALLDYWTVSDTVESFSLQPGTYQLCRRSENASQDINNVYEDLNYTFTVTKQATNKPQIVTVYLPVRSRTVKVLVQGKMTDNGDPWTPITSFSVTLAGTSKNGEKYSFMGKTDDDGIVTFTNVPYSVANSCRLTVNSTAIPPQLEKPNLSSPFSVDGSNPSGILSIDMYHNYNYKG